MKLVDKLGFNCFHDMGYDLPGYNNLQRCIDFCVESGVKYIRPAFALQQNEFDGKVNNWRIEPFKRCINAGLTPILNAYPAQLYGKLADENAEELVNQAVTAYATILDNFIKNGIGADKIIMEAWNEADGGGFADTSYNSKNNETVINNYLEFNHKLGDECHVRGIKFIDFDSISYPYVEKIQKVMSQYNEKMASYDNKPYRVSFHPYCEQLSENSYPEYYLDTFNLQKWPNLDGLPLAVTEFGYPSVEWGRPFSGKWAFQYARDVMIRQIIIMDYLDVDPIVIYSANTNPDESTAGTDDCWGTYQYYSSTGKIELTDLGRVLMRFIQDMQGYSLTSAVLVPDDTKKGYGNYAFEYTNENGDKKLFYWNPLGSQNQSLTWNGSEYNLSFNQHVQILEEVH